MNEERKEIVRPSAHIDVRLSVGLLVDLASALLLGLNPKLIIEYEQVCQRLDQILNGEIRDPEEAKSIIEEAKKIEHHIEEFL